MMRSMTNNEICLILGGKRCIWRQEAESAAFLLRMFSQTWTLDSFSINCWRSRQMLNVKVKCCSFKRLYFYLWHCMDMIYITLDWNIMLIFPAFVCNFALKSGWKFWYIVVAILLVNGWKFWNIAMGIPSEYKKRMNEVLFETEQIRVFID